MNSQAENVKPFKNKKIEITKLPGFVAYKCKSDFFRQRLAKIVEHV